MHYEDLERWGRRKRWVNGDSLMRATWLLFGVEEPDNLKGRCCSRTLGLHFQTNFSGKTWRCILNIANKISLFLEGGSVGKRRRPLTLLIVRESGKFQYQGDFGVASFEVFLTTLMCSGTAWRRGSKGKTIVPCLSSKIWIVGLGGN